MKYQKNLNSKSFTLLEIILSIALISIGTVAVVRCISLAITANYSIDVSLVALNLAQQKMESFFNTAYSSITVETNSDTPSGYSGYTRSWTVTNNTYNSVSVYKTISVTVTSTANKGQNQSVTLVSYITNYLPYN